MTIGQEIPYRRGKHDRDTGSRVFDHERQAAREESDGDSSHDTADEQREGAA